MTTIPTTETILKTVERALPDRSYIVATVGLCYIGGNRTAYWSATGETYEPRGTWSGEARKRNGRDADGGGAIGREIVRVFPKLAPIEALHLSDPDGVPMHALENGWYFYTGEGARHEREHYGDAYAERNGTDMERVGRLLRVDPADLPGDMGKAEFIEFVDAQRDRWRAESLAAYDLLLSL